MRKHRRFVVSNNRSAAASGVLAGLVVVLLATRAPERARFDEWTSCSYRGSVG